MDEQEINWNEKPGIRKEIKKKRERHMGNGLKRKH